MSREGRLLKNKILLLVTASILLLGLFNWQHFDFIKPRVNIPGLVEERCVVERIVSSSDRDGDGIYDLDDIVQGARKDLAAKPTYKDAYYAGGYPPDNEGVCTDVIWRALQNAGYNLKVMMDRDIKENPGDYPRVGGSPEPNIDFRRVPNQEAFFKKYADMLTTEIKPWNPENLKQGTEGTVPVVNYKWGNRGDGSKAPG